MLFSRTSGRRLLRFVHLDDILEEVVQLSRGHRTLGAWTLAQICHHLAETQEFSVDPTEPEIRTTRLYRATVGRVALRMLLWFRFIPEGRGNLVPPTLAELGTATERLRNMIVRVSVEPMVATHPIFGRLTRDQWRRFHLHHAAHHLSFVTPDRAS